MTRIQPWTEPALMQREQVFEALTAKAIKQTVRKVVAQLREGILTAAPVQAPAVNYAATEAAVMATWEGYVAAELSPFLTNTFLTSATAVVEGVAAASGEVVDHLTNTYAQEFLAYAENRMVGIGEQLWLAIRSELEAGFEAGEGIKEIAARLSQVAGLATPRALTVARTEIISAANAGSYLQMINAGFEEKVTKVWLATEDTRTRASHRHADNQGVLLTDEFSVDIYSGDVKTGTEGLEFPGDPTGTPGNIINCRCSLAFDFEDDDEDGDVLSAASFVEKQHPRDNEGKFKKKGIPGADALKIDKIKYIIDNKLPTLPQGQKKVFLDNIDQDDWDQLTAGEQLKVQDAVLNTSHPEAKLVMEKKLNALIEGEGPTSNVKSAVEKLIKEGLPDTTEKRPLGGVDAKTGKPLVPGKPTKLRVQLLYNTKFENGAIMAVRKDSGERIVWDEDAKKIKRQKLVDGKYQTTEALTRGNAYAKWKDEDGWSIPDAATLPQAAEAGAPAPVSAPALSVGKPVALKVQLIYQTPFNDGDTVAVKPSTGEKITWDAGKKRMVVHAADGTTTEYTRGALYKAYKDDAGWHLPGDGEPDDIVDSDAPTPDITSADIVSPEPSQDVLPAPAAVPFQTVSKIGTGDEWTAALNDMKVALNDPSTPEGTVLFDLNNISITKTADGVATLKTAKGEKIIYDGDLTPSSFIDNVLSIGKPATPPPPSFIPVKKKITGKNVIDSDIAYVDDNFSKALIGDVLLETDAVTIEKANDDQVSINMKDDLGNFTTKDIQDLTADHVNDFIELNTTPSASADPNAAVTAQDLDFIKSKFAATEMDDDIFENAKVTVTKVSKNFLEVLNKNTGTSENWKVAEVTVDDINSFAGGVTAPAAPKLANGLELGQLATDLKKAGESPAVLPLDNLYDDEDFYVLKISSKGVQVVNKGTFESKILKNEDLTADKLAETLGGIGLGHVLSGVTPSAPVVQNAVGNVEVTNKPLTPSVGPVKPVKMSYGLLVNPKTTGKYTDGQMLAFHPETEADAGDELLTWNAKTKKFDVYTRTTNPPGDWQKIFSYNKQAAYKNLKDDEGWTTVPAGIQNPAGTAAPTVHGGAAAPAVSIPKTSTASLKFDIDQLNAASDTKIASISDADAKKVFNEFKTGKSTMYLTSSGDALLEAVLRAQKKHNDANPGNSLNMLETIALVDKESAKVAGVANSKLYQKNILDWLGTPAGKKKANEVIAEFRMTPAEKAKLIADKAAVAKAALDAQLKGLYAVSISKPEIRPDDAIFSKVSTTTAASWWKDIQANNPVTATQQTALKKYTGSYYTTINNTLRNKIPPTESVLKDIVNMQKGMRPIPQDVFLVRGVNAIPGILPGNIAEYKDLIGKEFTEPGFSSTSITHPFGYQVQLEIEAPKGTAGIYVKSFSNVASENELLLAAGTNFKMVSAVQKGHQIFVRVRVVP